MVSTVHLTECTSPNAAETLAAQGTLNVKAKMNAKACGAVMA